MRLYEFEVKQIFRERGIPVPYGKVIQTVEEAEGIFREINKPVVIKAQTLVGRRGKAGLIKIANTLEELKSAVSELLGLEYGGEKIGSVLIEEKIESVKEMYVGIIIDSRDNCFTMIACPEGGIEIEEIAERFPEKIIRERIDPLIGLQEFQVRKLVKKLNLKNKQAMDCSRILRLMYEIFINNEALMVEINPLSVTTDGSLLALDAKMEVDDFAIHRHPEFQAIQSRRKDLLLGPELRSVIAREKGLVTYVELDGDIAVVSNGASTCMATMDLLHDLGGRPACHCEIGATPTIETVKSGLEIATSNRNTKVVLVNVIGGGFTRLEEVARGIVEYVKENVPKVPIIVRLSGVGDEDGINILKRGGIEAFSDLLKAVERSIDICRTLKAS